LPTTSTIAIILLGDGLAWQGKLALVGEVAVLGSFVKLRYVMSQEESSLFVPELLRKFSCHPRTYFPELLKKITSCLTQRKQ
jgi:hypothetical protein